MSRYDNLKKIKPSEREELLLALCQAMAVIKDTREAARVLTDLLTEAEAEMIARRLKIARLLINGETTEKIAKKIQCGHSTITRIREWLMEAGDGFRLVFSRVKESVIEKYSKDYRRRDPLLMRQSNLKNLPFRLLDDIVHSANQKQRKKLLETVKILKKQGKLKSKLFKDLEAALLRKGN